MTNREKLLHTSEFDLLKKINDYFNSVQDEAYSAPKTYEFVCILDAITQRISDCPSTDFDVTGYETMCDACIAAWLNSEYDGRW